MLRGSCKALMGASLAASSYRHPDLFDGLHTLDLMELGGSMAAAAAPLNLTQPTISRRYQQLCKDFGLGKASRRRVDGLLYGESQSIRLLRRAFQSHRLGSGVFRLAVDSLRQGLLGGAPPILPIPVQCRQASSLHRLVRSHILDGALVSSLEIQALLPERPMAPDHLALAGSASGPSPTPVADAPTYCRNAFWEWEGCMLIPLGCWQLGLVAPEELDGLPPRWSEVAVPPLDAAPGLASAVRQQQWMARPVPKALSGASNWRQWLEAQGLPCIATPSWFAALSCDRPGLRWLALTRPIQEQIWLLVNTSDWDQFPVLAAQAQAIRQAIGGFHASAAYSNRQRGVQLVC